jgi:hypothetical protein
MPAMTVDEMVACEPCSPYDRPRLLELFAGRERLTAREMLALAIPLEHRVWAMMRAEPSIDWASVTAGLYQLIDPGRYSAAEGTLDMAAKFGPDPDTAAVHVAAYGTEIGVNLLTQAIAILEEALP